MYKLVFIILSELCPCCLTSFSVHVYIHMYTSLRLQTALHSDGKMYANMLQYELSTEKWLHWSHCMANLILKMTWFTLNFTKTMLPLWVGSTVTVRYYYMCLNYYLVPHEALL